LLIAELGDVFHCEMFFHRVQAFCLNPVFVDAITQPRVVKARSCPTTFVPRVVAWAGRECMASIACASSGRPCVSAHDVCHNTYESPRFLVINPYDRHLNGIGIEIAPMQSGLMH
jgi:hypothetical protein